MTKTVRIKKDTLLRFIAKYLDIGGPEDAADNLLGAKIDLERQSADPICVETVTRVWKQLAEIQEALREEGYVK